ncbi:MAG TPA: GxxExxY protein [Opitutaceae bacterium]|nr:GxxExxY protein [Opitutaceae bacterium]
MDQDSQLTGAVIGATIAVHRELGPGLDEAAYEESLSIKLGALGIEHVCQKPQPLLYKGATLDCGFRLDVLVNGRLPIELKAVETILPIHEAQLLTYLRLSSLCLGLLINFNVPVLKDGVRRKVLTRPRAAQPSQTLSTSAELDPLSTSVLNAAMEVHRTLGPGLLRSAYEECLCHELELQQVEFVRRHGVPLYFEGRPLNHHAEVPLFVDDRVPVICLSVDTLTPLHESRLLALLRQTHSAHGFLLNFNALTLAKGIRRLTLK